MAEDIKFLKLWNNGLLKIFYFNIAIVDI